MDVQRLPLPDVRNVGSANVLQGVFSAFRWPSPSPTALLDRLVRHAHIEIATHRVDAGGVEHDSS
jgi:hypothetical protein